MISLKKAFFAALMAGTMLSGVAPPALAQTRDATGRIKIDYQTFTLPNGLTTIVYTDHTTPNVYVGVRYRVGSKDEPDDRTGFAHLFEHLMFQPTAHRQGEFFLPLDAVGATNMNGMTTTDATDYYETVPTNALDRALWMEADRMGSLLGGITQAVLDEQRAVVKNEKRQGELQPGARASERYLESYYPQGHPYSHSVIGSMEDIDAASLDDVRQWFTDHYGAANAVLVLSGDIDLETAREKVTRYFGGVRPGAPVNRLDQWTPSFPEIKRDVVYENVATASFSRTWPLSNDDPRRNTLLQLVAKTLAGGKNTPLQKLLVDERQLALGVSAGVTENALTSSFTLSVALKPGVTKAQVEPVLNAALQTYFENGPAAQDVDTIIAATDNALLRSLESNARIGGWLMDGYFDHADPGFFLQQRAWIQDASAQEMKTLARSLLQRPYYEMVQMPTPIATATDTGVDPNQMPAAGDPVGQVRFPPIREAVLSNGLKLVVAQRPRLPIFDASLVFATGSSAEDAYGRDVAGQAFGLLSSGTDQHTASQLARELGRIGVSVGASAAARQSAVSWSGATQHMDRAFALVSEMVRHPSYPQSEIEKRLDGLDARFEAYERNPINAAGALYARAIWGDTHPMGRIPTRDDSRIISRDAIQRFHDHEVGPNDATLYMVGDITLEQAKAMAETAFGDWKRVAPTPLGLNGSAQGAKARIILVDAPGSPQTSISAGHVVGPFDKDQSAANALTDAVLGSSFHSRLNTDLREQKGWAYGFGGGTSNASVGQRVFTASGSVQADKTAASMIEIRNEIRDFVTTRPITEEELDREKTAAVLAVPSGFTTGGSFLSSIISSAAYGLPYDRAEGTMDRLSAVTLDQARALAIQTYRPDDLTWVIVGDLGLIEKDVRALNLGPVEVWDVYGRRLR